jgi:hypothetical protein
MHHVQRLSLALAGLLAVATPAMATTFVPTRFDDPIPNGCQPNDCSLREAVIDANALPGGGTILLSAGTYHLTRPTTSSDAAGDDLDVTRPITIVGQGSGITVIRSGHTTDGLQTRVLEIHQTQLTLRQLSVRHGGVAGSGGVTASGGCVAGLSAVLVAEQVEFDTCRADVGGAIALARSRAEFHGVTLRGSLGRQAGGALALTGTPTSGSAVTVSGNASNGDGGAVHVASSSVASTISWRDSLIVANQAPRGGAIHVAAGGRLVVDNGGGASLLRLSANQASQSGGAVAAVGEFDARWVAVLSNTATEDGGGLHASGRALVRDSEFAFNSAGRDGGGAALRSGGNPSGGHVIDRVAFTDNGAGRHGGGLSVTTSSTLQNISSHSNEAQSGGGIATVTSMRLEHSSFLGDTAPAVRIASGMLHVRNTVIDGGCVLAVGGTFGSLGGNAQTLGAPTPCPSVPAYSAAQLALTYGPVGGLFDAVRFTSAASPLRNGGVGGSPVTQDIRGAARMPPPDIGAWEWP